MSTQDNIAVQLIDVSKNYKSGKGIIHAVNKFNVEFYKGQFVCIMGPSGSGKSTLLSLIAGLTAASEGTILIDGKILNNLSETQRSLVRRHGIGIVFQAINLHEGLTALENVQLPMLIAGVPLKERKDKAIRLLELVGLLNRMNHFPYELSGGEQQRVGIARALANDASILLADEPTGDLDHHTGEHILDFLIEINKTRNITIIMVTHDSSLIRENFRLIRLVDGKITSDEIIKDAKAYQDDFEILMAK